MYSLSKYHLRTGRMGAPLPDPFPQFEWHRVKFRRGGTSLIAGQPGAFKSVTALNMLAKWCAVGLTGFYFSADSDEFTVARRMFGIISGKTTDEVEEIFKRRDYGFISPVLDAVSSARFEYRAQDIDGIADRLAAYEAVYGDYPDVVIVDNLINFASSAQDWAGMIDLQNELDALARETKSHVCVLHHASDGFPFGQPVPRFAIQGKVTQIPRLVLTIAATDNNIMVACVKNTNGPQYPDASKWMNFHILPSLQVQDVEYEGMVG